MTPDRLPEDCEHGLAQLDSHACRECKEIIASLRRAIQAAVLEARADATRKARDYFVERTRGWCRFEEIATEIDARAKAIREGKE